MSFLNVRWASSRRPMLGFAASWLIATTAAMADSASAKSDGSSDAHPTFEIRLLTVDANEGIAAGDVDGDGIKDLVAGRSWYRGGDFVSRPLRIIEDWNGYVQSNGDFLRDVNGDGRLDVIAGSYLPTQVHWYENPGQEALRLGQLWPTHLWMDTEQSKNEGQLLVDVDGDDNPEWVVNSWDKTAAMTVWRIGDDGVSMTRHEIGPINGHGLAVGDINGDGRSDILFAQGWYEQPPQPWSGPWTLHADWDLHSSIPMLVVDVDHDGDNDLLHGAGHHYGLTFWQNQGVVDGTVQWHQQSIDDSYSQIHALAWADVDGDGADDLIAGKRYYAHNGKDPGGNEMPCLYYYTIEFDYPDGNAQDEDASVSFTRHVIDEGHVGCGLQIVADDLDGDQDIDIAVAGKSGTYVILNQLR